MALSESAALKELLEESGCDYAVLWTLDEHRNDYHLIYHSGICKELTEDFCRNTFKNGCTSWDFAREAMQRWTEQIIIPYQLPYPASHPSVQQFHSVLRTQTILYIPVDMRCQRGRALLEMGTANIARTHLTAIARQILAGSGREEDDSFQELIQVLFPDPDLFPIPLELPAGSSSSGVADSCEMGFLESEWREDVPRDNYTSQGATSLGPVVQFHQGLTPSSTTGPPATGKGIPLSPLAARKTKADHARKEKQRRSNMKEHIRTLRDKTRCKKTDKNAILSHTVNFINDQVAKSKAWERERQGLNETVRRLEEMIEKLRAEAGPKKF